MSFSDSTWTAMSKIYQNNNQLRTSPRPGCIGHVMLFLLLEWISVHHLMDLMDLLDFRQFNFNLTLKLRHQHRSKMEAPCTHSTLRKNQVSSRIRTRCGTVMW